MPANSHRFQALSRVAVLALCLDVLVCLAACAYAGYSWGTGDLPRALAFGLGGLVALLAGALLYAQFILLRKFVSNSYRTYDAVLDAGELLRQQGTRVRTMAENSTLSDWAKRIVYREKDYEFLRDTIHGAVVRQDWAAAEHLIKDIDEEFGYHEEAQRLREELTKARQATLEEKIAAAIERFELLCAACKWEQARRETRRLQALFADDARIAGLPNELELRRRQHKRQLLKEYDEAVQTHEVDRAHDLLLELDAYLAPNEAAALKESARGVFKAKLLQMGVQFSLAVSDRHFDRAINIGRQLIDEFPNSRYATEISQMMPALRKRVAQEVTAHGPADHP
ncbi:MAG: hypothetical protein KKB50_08675 [Planctomycetes bacterium]|nr:hypothetical protein [Planctomycetota bacterium]